MIKAIIKEYKSQSPHYTATELKENEIGLFNIPPKSRWIIPLLGVNTPLLLRATFLPADLGTRFLLLSITNSFFALDPVIPTQILVCRLILAKAIPGPVTAKRSSLVAGSLITGTCILFLDGEIFFPGR